MTFSSAADKYKRHAHKTRSSEVLNQDVNIWHKAIKAKQGNKPTSLFPHLLA